MEVSVVAWNKAVPARAGDVFFTHSNSLLGGLIRWGETEPGETNGTWTNHAGVVVDSGWIGNPGFPGYTEAVVVEALWTTRKGPLKVNGTGIKVYRPTVPWTTTEVARLRWEAEQYVGARYGWWKLLGFLVKRATGGRVDPTLWYYIKGRPICSFLAAMAVEATGRRQLFGMPPQAADPDEMLDYCQAHPDTWQLVGEVNPDA